MSDSDVEEVDVESEIDDTLKNFFDGPIVISNQPEDDETPEQAAKRTSDIAAARTKHGIADIPATVTQTVVDNLAKCASDEKVGCCGELAAHAFKLLKANSKLAGACKIALVELSPVSTATAVLRDNKHLTVLVLPASETVTAGAAIDIATKGSVSGAFVVDPWLSAFTDVSGECKSNEIADFVKLVKRANKKAFGFLTSGKVFFV
jgi:hypothetical protein